MVLDFNFSGNKSPLPDCLLKSAKNLKNIFRITAVNLCFDGNTKFVRPLGPSGGLFMFGHWEYDALTSFPLDLDHQILQSLNYFSLHMTPSLTITFQKEPYVFSLRVL